MSEDTHTHVCMYIYIYMVRGFFIGHRRYVKDGHWIGDEGFLIGKR